MSRAYHPSKRERDAAKALERGDVGVKKVDVRLCSECGVYRKDECGRVICGNRRMVTASVGDGGVEMFGHSGSFVHGQKYGKEG